MLIETGDEKRVRLLRKYRAAVTTHARSAAVARDLASRLGLIADDPCKRCSDPRALRRHHYNETKG